MLEVQAPTMVLEVQAPMMVPEDNGARGQQCQNMMVLEDDSTRGTGTNDGG